MCSNHDGVPPYRLVLAATVVFLLALGLRVAYVAERPVTLRFGLGPYADTFTYARLADNLVERRGYSQSASAPYAPSAYKPPLYGVFLARLFGMGVQSFRHIRFIQAGLDSFSAVFVFAAAWWMTRRLLDAILAGSFLALCPYTIHYARAVLSDWLGATLMAAALALLILAMTRRRMAALMGSGAVLGGLILTRPVFLLFPVVIAAGLPFAWTGAGKRRAAAALLFVSCALAVPGFWMIRNAVVFHRLIPVSAGGMAVGLLRGTWETAENWSWSDVPDDAFETERERRDVQDMLARYTRAAGQGRMEELFDLNTRLKRLAHARIKAAPMEYLALSLRRLPLLWWHHDVPMFSDPDPPGAYVLVCLALALFSFVWRRECGWPLAVLWLVPVYVTVLHLPAHCEPRFTLPAMPALAVLAGCGAAGAGRFLAGSFGGARGTVGTGR